MDEGKGREITSLYLCALLCLCVKRENKQQYIIRTSRPSSGPEKYCDGHFRFTKYIFRKQFSRIFASSGTKMGRREIL